MTGDQIDGAETASLIAWWREAGVDTLVAETPFDWLSRAEPVAGPAVHETAPTPFPATLDAFTAWLAAGDDVPEALWGSSRIGPVGDPASNLMIVADVPEPADAAAGQLYAGEIGRLFDRMLAAIGRDRASVYLVPLASIRPPGGIIDAVARDRLVEIMRHHIALAAPKRLLLMGNAPSRALIGMDLRDARGGIRKVNHARGTVDAVATYPPRFLFERPVAKAEAWKDLLMLIGGLPE